MPATASAPYSVTRIGLPCFAAQALSSASSPRSAAARSPGDSYQP